MSATATKVKAPKPLRSGWCGLTNPPDSHARCSGHVGEHPCPCACHAQPVAEPEPNRLQLGRLTVLPDMVQGTDEWHDQRRGMVTASVVGRLITAKTLQPADNDESRGLTALLTAERITGYTEPTYMSDDMLRGIEDEPRAVEKYSEHYAPARTVGFMVREVGGARIGYSPDALVGDDGLVEVKSRRQKKHLQTIVADEVPAENLAQLQCGLLVSGRAWCDYVSYCGGMPLWVRRVEPDPDWAAAIVAAVETFERRAEQMIAAYHAATTDLPATERAEEMEMVI